MNYIADKTTHELVTEAFKLLTTYTPEQLKFINELLNLTN